MALNVTKKDNKFRVEIPEFSTDWLSDTTVNRHITIVWLRLLVDAQGKPLFTLRELAKIVGSENRQAASQHLEDFRQCGENFQAFVTRKRKVDNTVVECVSKELSKTPLVGRVELAQRVNASLERKDITASNISASLEQIPCACLLGTLQKRLEEGKVHYKESYLLEEMMRSFSGEAGHQAGLDVPVSDEGMEVSDPTAIKALVTPDVSMDEVSSSLAWVTFIMTLFYWNVPLSVLGRWFKVHKSTILRWILGLALTLWSILYQWILDKVKGEMVYLDEKWIKIRGKWHYWYVVLDAKTELPILAALLPSRTKWACRWIGCKLKLIRKVPKVIITDGLRGYYYLLNGSKHVLCRFHHQQGVTQWLKKHFSNEEEIKERKKAMKKIFQTNDKRTVRRRLARLREKADDWSITPWVTTVSEKLPSLICTIGSIFLPSTTNAIERFFRAFTRFYKTRCGFQSVISAKRELILFLVVYLFTQRNTDGRAPIEAIVPEAPRMPLYRLVNDPFGSLLELRNVKEKVKMADFLLFKEAVT